MKKSLLFIISLGLISASAFGATAASWAVTDNSDPFGVKVSVIKPTEEKTVYLNGGGSSLWNQGNPQFYVHVFGNGTGAPSQDIKMDACTQANYYKVIIPENYTQVIFARCKPEMTTFNWDDVWNQTEDLYVPTDEKDTFTITGWGSDGSKVCPGTWSVHTCVAGTPVKENEVLPTCEEPGGYDMVTHCTICNKVMSSSHTVVPARGHDWNITYTWNVDNTECVAEGICTHDASHTIRETASGSAITSVVTTEPTCHSIGKRTLTATFTNTDIPTETKVIDIPMTEHNVDTSTYYHDGIYHWHACINAGCTYVTDKAEHTGGTATEEHGKICSVCNFEYTSPIGHTHELEHISAVAATCTTTGNIEYWHCTKTNCDKYFSDEGATTEISQLETITPALGHDMTEHTALAPTCTVPGNSLYYSCGRCNKYFSDYAGTTEITSGSWIIPATGHSMDETWHSDATGHWHVCTKCGEKGTVTTHTFDPATDKCSVCGFDDPNANYYVEIYSGDTLKSKTKMTLNTKGDNANKEMYATGIQMDIGDKAIIYSNKGTNKFKGTPWQHDLSTYTAVKTNDSSNYVANFAGTYDFYSKFTKTGFTIDDYDSTYVLCPDKITFYFVKPNSWSDWTGDFYYYLFGGDGELKPWRGDKFTKVKDNYVYSGDNKGTLYSLTLDKSAITSRNKYIVNCTGGKQTTDIYYSWFNSYSFNGIYLNYDGGDKVNVFTYSPS